MKIISTFLLSLLISMVAIAPASAQKKVKENTAVSKGIEFSTKFYDYGEVSAGNYPGYRLEFVNNSNKSVRVAGFGRVCNLTVPSYTQQEVKPGERGYIVIVLNPRDLKGMVRKNFQIVFAYAEGTEQMMTGKNILLQGNIVGDSKSI